MDLSWNGDDQLPFTIVDGRIVHTRESGGNLKVALSIASGSTGRALKFRVINLALVTSALIQS